jgi:hypothetical protein
MKTLWRRIVDRYKRLDAELVQVAIELGKDDALRPMLPAFPARPFKPSTIILICVLGLFVLLAFWTALKDIVLPLAR